MTEQGRAVQQCTVLPNRKQLQKSLKARVIVSKHCTHPHTQGPLRVQQDRLGRQAELSPGFSSDITWGETYGETMTAEQWYSCTVGHVGRDPGAKLHVH